MSVADIENTTLRRIAVAAYYVPAMIFIALLGTLDIILRECSYTHRLAKASWRKR